MAATMEAEEGASSHSVIPHSEQFDSGQPGPERQEEERRALPPSNVREVLSSKCTS